MKRHSLLKIIALIASFVLSSTIQADDIEIYLNNAGGASSKPNVLFVLDNAAEWSSQLVGGTGETKQDAVHEGLYAVINNPDFLNKVRVGIMTFQSQVGSKGGKVIAAVKDLDSTRRDWLNSKMYAMSVNGTAITATTHPLVEGTVDTTSEAGLTKVIKADGGTAVLNNGTVTVTFADTSTHVLANGDTIAFTAAIDKASSSPYATELYEAYLYYKGDAPEAGTAAGARPDDATFATDGYDPAALDGAKYLSPTVGNVCAHNYIVFLGTGSPDMGENNTARPLLEAEDGVNASDPISLDPNKYEANWADEMARFMNTKADVVGDIDGKQNIVSYVIDIYDADDEKNPTKPWLGARALLSSIANQGGGNYYKANSAEDVKAILEDILDEVQAVNDVFAAVSLPVSVNVRGTHLNQVYIGVFRPDPEKKPRWFGNLKMYQFGVGISGLQLVDADGDLASNSVTGFINNTARSFWTHDSTFWSFSPRGTPESSNDNPDGDVVEKGAVAQQLRDMAVADRKLYTCNPCAAGDLLSSTPFDNTNVTSADLGAADSTERDAIIDWVKGADIFDEDGDESKTDMRASVHGDVLHSRPAVINYGGDDNDIYIFYGANDGVFHAVKGGKETDNPTGGDELWGFVMPEHFGQLKALYDNSVMADITDKPYFADGSISVYRNPDLTTIDKTGSDDVILYVTMRRGGRFLYAIDVTNPSAPKLKWRKSSSDYSKLGHTWSTPKLAKVAAHANPVIIMGLGYDPEDDSDSPSTFTMGQGVIVLDAFDGSLVREFGTGDGFTHPIPSDVAIIDHDGDEDQYADFVYVGDTGGQVWRIDIRDSNENKWSVSKLASVGSDQKFLYPPDIVRTEQTDYTYSVLIGSGNREDPLDTTVSNGFYMFKDDMTPASWPYVTTINMSTTLLDVSDIANATEENLASYKGWYWPFPNAGEKVIGAPVTAGGATYFYTNEPQGETVDAEGNITSCATGLGTSYEYIVDFETGGAVSTFERVTTLEYGGLIPSPVIVVVEIGGTIYTGMMTDPSNIGAPPGGPLPGTRQRVYWYKQLD